MSDGLAPTEQRERVCMHASEVVLADFSSRSAAMISLRWLAASGRAAPACRWLGWRWPSLGENPYVRGPCAHSLVPCV
jgi:hypothetical protein